MKLKWLLFRTIEDQNNLFKSIQTAMDNDCALVEKMIG